jgi:hypothetical protein
MDRLRTKGGQAHLSVVESWLSVPTVKGCAFRLIIVPTYWRDTLDDRDVLAMLREYNTTGKVLHRPQ